MSQLALSLFTNPPTVRTVKFQYSVGLFSLQAAHFFPQETFKSNPHTRSMRYRIKDFQSKQNQLYKVCLPLTLSHHLFLLLLILVPLFSPLLDAVVIMRQVTNQIHFQDRTFFSHLVQNSFLSQRQLLGTCGQPTQFQNV